MADKILLESGPPDGILLEDGSGVLLLDVTVQAGFHSRMVGGVRRMGAVTGGGGPVLARALWLPLLGVA